MSPPPSDRRAPRRRRSRRLQGAVGLAVVAVFFFEGRVAESGLPPMSLPPGIPPIAVQRLLSLHARYSSVRALEGPGGVRRQVIADLRSYSAQPALEQSMDEVVNWVRLGGWGDAADCLVDAAELGVPQVRANCAAFLAAIPTPLLMANGCGARIVRLHLSETDPVARADWLDLRERLGI